MLPKKHLPIEHGVRRKIDLRGVLGTYEGKYTAFVRMSKSYGETLLLLLQIEKYIDDYTQEYPDVRIEFLNVLEELNDLELTGRMLTHVYEDFYKGDLDALMTAVLCDDRKINKIELIKFIKENEHQVAEWEARREKPICDFYNKV